MSRTWITGASVQGAAAVLSVVLAVGAFSVSVNSCRIAKESYGVAKDGEARLNQQDKRQYASKVFVTEGPSSTGTPTNRVNEWVYNASGSPIFGVWVQGRNNRVTLIWTIAPCEMYELKSYTPGPSPVPDFQAVTLYFRDPNGQWQRDEKTQELKEGYKQMPENGTDHTLRNAPIDHCA